MKNRMRVISAVAAEMLVNPNNATTNEINKKINAHFSNDIAGSFAVGNRKARFGSIIAAGR